MERYYSFKENLLKTLRANVFFQCIIVSTCLKELVIINRVTWTEIT